MRKTRRPRGQLWEHARGGHRQLTSSLSWTCSFASPRRAPVPARTREISPGRARSRTMGGGGIGAALTRRARRASSWARRARPRAHGGVQAGAAERPARPRQAGGGRAARRRSGRSRVDARASLNIKPKASAEELREAAERLAAMHDPTKGSSSTFARRGGRPWCRDPAPPRRRGRRRSRRATTRERGAEGRAAEGAPALARRPTAVLHAARELLQRLRRSPVCRFSRRWDRRQKNNCAQRARHLSSSLPHSLSRRGAFR